MLAVQARLKTFINGTVLKKIWLQIILVTVYALLVVAIYAAVPGFGKKAFHLNFTDIFGIVTGLLLVFRTQIAYNRYLEGRKLWASLSHKIGTLARLIWISVKENEAKDVLEKKTMLNLLAAFPLATKHYLRNEYTHECEDSKEYLSGFPEVLMKSSTSVQDDNNMVGRSEDIPDFVCPRNAPAEISYYLGEYLDRLAQKGMTDPSVMTILQESLSALGDHLCSFEKILNTPVPSLYSRHLEHCIYLYLFAIPFQLVHYLTWLTVPAMTLASFAILGILKFGIEIENPFGHGDLDLPLDTFCKSILNEIRLIMSLKLPKDWILSPNNFPCGFTFGMNAQEILNGKTMEEVKEMFRQNASMNPIKICSISKPLDGNDNLIIPTIITSEGVVDEP